MTEGERRVALVTGASRGIGEATARHLAAANYAVILAARSATSLDSLVSDLGSEAALAVPTDLADLDAVDALVDAAVTRFGHIDVLVNNAGVLPIARRAEQISRNEWQDVLALNLTAPWYLACRSKEHMRPGSVIVNVSSTASHYPSVGLSHYNASKAAITMITRCLALEWARDGIRVVSISPGKVDTKLAEPILAWTERNNVSPNPLGRIGTPDEVAELVSFLVSERAAYVTGSTIVIDGGELLVSGTGTLG